MFIYPYIVTQALCYHFLMENTFYNFTSEKIYKKTSWERNLCLGAAGLFALTAGLTYLGVNAGLGPVSIFPIAIGIFTLATALGVWLLHIGEKRQLKKSLKDLSVDDVLYEINHNCIFIFGRDNKASFFLTPKYLVVQNKFVCKTSDIARARLFKGRPRINSTVIYLKNGTEYDSGKLLGNYGKYDEFAAALRRVNPSAECR